MSTRGLTTVRKPPLVLAWAALALLFVFSGHGLLHSHSASGHGAPISDSCAICHTGAGAGVSTAPVSSSIGPLARYEGRVPAVVRTDYAEPDLTASSPRAPPTALL